MQKQLSAKLGLGIGIVLLALPVGCVPLNSNATIPQTPAPEATASGDADETAANGITITYERFGPIAGEAILLIGGTGMHRVEE